MGASKYANWTQQTNIGRKKTTLFLSAFFLDILMVSNVIIIGGD